MEISIRNNKVLVNNISTTCIIIAGQTATGKSKLAVNLLHALKSVKPIIINADSVQMYHVLPKLSAQPEDLTDHYLYNFLDISQDYSVYQWLQDVHKLIRQNYFPIIVGGSGFYLNALLHGIYPFPARSEHTQWDHLSTDECKTLAHQIDPQAVIKYQDKQRLIRFLDVYHKTGQNLLNPTIPKQKILNEQYYCIQVVSSQIKQRIQTRLTSHIDQYIEEVKLQSDNHSKLHKIIGYTEIQQYLTRQISYQDTINHIYTRTCQYAKRQGTWFRKYYKADTICSCDEKLIIM